MQVAQATGGDLVRADSRLLRHKPSKVAVLGSGSFGTANACHLARLGNEVWLLTRREEVAKGIISSHKNPSAFSEIGLPYNVTATTSAADALRGATMLVYCIPVQSSYAYLRALRHLIPHDCVIVNTSKGMYVHRESASASHNRSGGVSTTGLAASSPAVA